MKLKTFLFSLCVIFSSAVGAHGDHGKPQYGGIYGEAGTFQAELVAAAGEVSLYLSVHGEPLASQGVSARLTVLGGGEKRELVLAPAGNNRLSAKLATPLARGSKVVASVSLPGKAAATIRYSLD